MARATPTRTDGARLYGKDRKTISKAEALALAKDLHERKASARLDLERASRVHSWEPGNAVCIVWELIEGIELAREAVIESIHYSEFAGCDVCWVRFPDNGERMKVDVARVRKHGYIPKRVRRRSPTA